MCRCYTPNDPGRDWAATPLGATNDKTHEQGLSWIPMVVIPILGNDMYSVLPIADPAARWGPIRCDFVGTVDVEKSVE